MRKLSTESRSYVNQANGGRHLTRVDPTVSHATPHDTITDAHAGDNEGAERAQGVMVEEGRYLLHEFLLFRFSRCYVK